MKKQIVILVLFSIQAVLFLNCCCRDDENPILSKIGANLPDSLAYKESIVTNTTYTLRTMDVNGVIKDTVASEDLAIRQILATSMTPQGQEQRAFKAIKLLSAQEAKLTAPEDNFFFGTMDIEASYVVNDDEYTFTITANDGIMKGYVNMDETQISIPFWALRKKAATGGTNVTAHYPLDYETFFTTNFSPGDSLVYITYDVIYEIE